jgi:hypothetical protein
LIARLRADPRPNRRAHNAVTTSTMLRTNSEVPAGAWRVVRKTEFDVQSTVDPDPRHRFVRD